MEGEQEIFFNCPYCFEQVSMLVETHYGQQSYIEDCQVCCHPIQITYRSENGEVALLDISRAQ